MGSSSSRPTGTLLSIDVGHNEVRLLSFESIDLNAPMRFHLHRRSLNEWTAAFHTFRAQKSAEVSSFQMVKHWSAQKGFLQNKTTCMRFVWGDYICLSYMRHDEPKKSKEIMINNMPTSVSKRLFAALKVLRKTREVQMGMMMFVEELCIEQGDVADRNAHVLRIGPIFQDAFSVHLWAKEDSELSHHRRRNNLHAVEACELVLDQYGQEDLGRWLRVTKEQCAHKPFSYRKQIDRLVPDEDFRRDLDPETDRERAIIARYKPLRDALRNLLICSYWHRIWTIPECAAAPSTVVTLVGLHWPYNLLTTKHNLTTAVERGLQVLKFAAHWQEWAALPPAHPHRGQLPLTRVHELAVIERTARYLNPLDKIYALLPLFPPSVAHRITIDYAHPEYEFTVRQQLRNAVPDWTTAVELAGRLARGQSPDSLRGLLQRVQDEETVVVNSADKRDHILGWVAHTEAPEAEAGLSMLEEPRGEEQQQQQEEEEQGEGEQEDEEEGDEGERRHGYYADGDDYGDDDGSEVGLLAHQIREAL
ncbi:hypothetical protein F4780DRAFT_787648 [Xylariomycetidae sp. FL0641]|nr:hypothetical protein F4780DRAFT_787648 [Xylariomycetidae sp. FL0641]